MNLYVLLIVFIYLSSIIVEILVIKWVLRRAERQAYPEMNEKEIRESTKLFWNKDE